MHKILLHLQWVRIQVFILKYPYFFIQYDLSCVIDAFNDNECKDLHVLKLDLFCMVLSRLLFFASLYIIVFLAQSSLDQNGIYVAH